MQRSVLRVVAAGLVFASMAVQAADFPATIPSYSAPLFTNWTGSYVSFSGGYSFDRANWGAPSGTRSAAGSLYAVMMNYNIPAGIWLWGPKPISVSRTSTAPRHA
jgi:hypothetical protein